MFEKISLFGWGKRPKVRRKLILPHIRMVDGTYTPVSPEQLANLGATEIIGDRRERQSKYATTLEMTLEDYALRVFSDDDLEEAVFLLTQYAQSRGYNIIGTPRQVLGKLFEFSERL